MTISSSRILKREQDAHSLFLFVPLAFPFPLVLPPATADSTLLPLVLFFLGALIVVFVLLDDAVELALAAVRFGSVKGPRLISYGSRSERIVTHLAAS
jgi:hypothetical protein